MPAQSTAAQHVSQDHIAVCDMIHYNKHAGMTIGVAGRRSQRLSYTRTQSDLRDRMNRDDVSRCLLQHLVVYFQVPAEKWSTAMLEYAQSRHVHTLDPTAANFLRVECERRPAVFSMDSVAVPPRTLAGREQRGGQYAA
jgi:hypothetical protein